MSNEVELENASPAECQRKKNVVQLPLIESVGIGSMKKSRALGFICDTFQNRKPFTVYTLV